MTAIEVANSAPVLESVSIVPVAPQATDTLNCLPGDVVDADGDEVTEYQTSWFVNDLELVDYTESTLSAYSESAVDDASDTGDTGSAGGSDTANDGDTGDSSTDAAPHFEAGDSVLCEVMPVDSFGAIGDAVASEAVTIQSSDEDTSEPVDTANDSFDSADPGMSAAQRAGESGGFGCGCGDSAGAASAFSIWGLWVALSWRRRRNA